MKVALVYDWANQIGGAERVLEALSEIWPEAPLYTSVLDRNKTPWAGCFSVIKTSFLQNIPKFSTFYRFFAPLIPIAFEQFDFSGFDVVVTLTSGPAKAIITKPGTCHLCYCLTPPRYLLGKRFLKRKWLFKYLSLLKSQDLFLSKRPDYFLAISKTVAGRIRRFYGRESFLVYPGLIKKKSLEKILNDQNSHFFKKEDYFLTVSRLVYYKRVDLIIRVFNKLGRKLIVVGDGPEKRELEVIARKNIEFLGKVSDKELSNLYRGARALICAGEEDFGVTSLEAQSYLTPVIAFKKGGYFETVKEGKTGEFFKSQNVESILKAIERFETRKYKKEDFVKNLNNFTKEKFLLEFKEIVEKLWKDYLKKNFI